GGEGGGGRGAERGVLGEEERRGVEPLGDVDGWHRVAAGHRRMIHWRGVARRPPRGARMARGARRARERAGRGRMRGRAAALGGAAMVLGLVSGCTSTGPIGGQLVVPDQPSPRGTVSYTPDPFDEGGPPSVTLPERGRVAGR